MQIQRILPRHQSRGRVVVCCLIVCALEGAAVTAGALHPEWFKRRSLESVEVVELSPDLGSPPVEQFPESQPEDSTPESTPEDTPSIEEETPPPPESDQKFIDPTPVPTPEKPKNAARAIGTVPLNAIRGAVYQPGAPTGQPNGIPGGKPSGTGKWSTSKPPYPPAAKQMKITGSGSFRVRTDASGNVISCETVQSISPILDNAVKNWASSHWKGPPNATSTVPVTFQLQ